MLSIGISVAGDLALPRSRRFACPASRFVVAGKAWLSDEHIIGGHRRLWFSPRSRDARLASAGTDVMRNNAPPQVHHRFATSGESSEIRHTPSKPCTLGLWYLLGDPRSVRSLVQIQAEGLVEVETRAATWVSLVGSLVCHVVEHPRILLRIPVELLNARRFPTVSCVALPYAVYPSSLGLGKEYSSGKVHPAFQSLVCHTSHQVAGIAKEIFDRMSIPQLHVNASCLMQYWICDWPFLKFILICVS